MKTTTLPNIHRIFGVLSIVQRSVSLSVAGLLLLASQASAGVAITSVVNGSAAPVLDSSYGTMELAFNLGSTAGGTLARDGITFTNNGVTGTTPVVYGTANGITATGSSTIGGTAISNANLSGADALYYTESWMDFNRPIFLGSVFLGSVPNGTNLRWIWDISKRPLKASRASWAGTRFRRVRRMIG